MSSPGDWAQFYHQNLTTEMASSGINNNNNPTNDSMITISSSSPNLPHASSSLSPEGRVSKPARRRSRASRRTPTTLLNTDTTNFRAMVQQFTGGPAPFGSNQPGPGFSFGQIATGGLGARPGQVNNTNSVMLPPGYRLQNQPWMISLGNNSINQAEHQGYVNVGRGHVEVSDGFLMGNNNNGFSSSSGSAGGRGGGGGGGPTTNVNRGSSFMF